MAWLLGIPQLHRGLGEGAKEYGGRMVAWVTSYSSLP